MIEKILQEFEKFKTPFTIDRNDDGVLVIIENGQPLITLKDFLEAATDDQSTFGQFLKIYNEVFGVKKKGDTKTKRQFAARIKEGFTIEDFQKAIIALHQDEWHKKGGETNIPYYYATPEYITRSDKLNKFKDLYKQEPGKRMVW